ncbi:MAG: hypothetical protein HFE71_08535 [Emergencia sp.]|jgi:hypothetical protein|nr:hypothetical protein [Emergencia sp.]
MILLMYAMRDVKAGFLTPQVESSDEIAIRNFQMAFKSARPDSLLFGFPEDYSLYRIGDYDTDSGAVTPCVPPLFLCNAPVEKGE